MWVLRLIVQWQQQTFVFLMFPQLNSIHDDYKYTTFYIHTGEHVIKNVHNTIENSSSSRCIIYKEINPGLSVHDVYTKKHLIPESNRIAFTRFRVSGHSLSVETRRWNRRGRGHIPFEERVCICGGGVQTERHVIENCSLTQNIRHTYNFVRLEDIFAPDFPHDTCCEIIFKILEMYD